MEVLQPSDVIELASVLHPWDKNEETKISVALD